MPCSIITREISIPSPNDCCIDVEIPSGASVIGVFTRKFDGKVIPSLHIAVPTNNGGSWAAAVVKKFFVCSESAICQAPWPYSYIGSFQLKPSGEIYHVFGG